MKVRLSDAYVGQLIGRIKSVATSAKSFDWDQLGGREAAQRWHDTFDEGCQDIEKLRDITHDEIYFAEILALLQTAMKDGRLRWSEIVELPF